MSLARSMSEKVVSSERKHSEKRNKIMSLDRKASLIFKTISIKRYKKSKSRKLEKKNKYSPKKQLSITNILGSEYKSQQSNNQAKEIIQKRSPADEKTSRARKVIFWKLFLVVSVILIWSSIIVPFMISGSRNAFDVQYNISINEQLLQKINLPNESVIICADTYTYSPLMRSCQPTCGKWSPCGAICFYMERILYALLAILGIFLGIIAMLTWLIFISSCQFQHHPIFIGIIVNLTQSIAIGISDIPGIYYFYCGGIDVDFETLNSTPQLRTQILGAIIHTLALSNNLWFVVALVHIYIRIAFPLRHFFNTRRKKIVIVMIELVICICTPILTDVISFGIGAHYIVSLKNLSAVSTSLAVNAAFGFVPFGFLTCLKMMIIVMIIYKARTSILMSGLNLKAQKIMPIEKKLLITSALFFLLIVVIGASRSAHHIVDPTIDLQLRNYEARITLDGTIKSHGMPYGNTTVSQLLTYEEQQLITDVNLPFQIYFLGLSERLMFIVVFTTVHINVFRIEKVKTWYRSKRESKNLVISNVIASSPIQTPV